MYTNYQTFGTNFKQEQEQKLAAAMVEPSETLEEYKERILQDNRKWNLHTAVAGRIRSLCTDVTRLSHEVEDLECDLEELESSIDRLRTEPVDLVQEGIKIYHEDRSYRAYCNEYGSGSDWKDEICSDITYLIREYWQDSNLPSYMAHRLRKIEHDLDCMTYSQYEATLASLRMGLEMPICALYEGM